MPSKKKVTYGPTVKKRAKRLLEALLAYVNWELEDVDGIDLSYRWQDETTQQPKLVMETKLRMLETLTAKYNHEGKLTKDQIRQALNDHLKDFLHILEDNRAKTQGEEYWHFTLTLWSRDKEKNLEQFDIEWESHRPKKSKQQEEMLRETVAETADETADENETGRSEDQAPNWRQICTHLLDEEAQRRQATGYGMGHEVNIYVPLGLVKPKQQARRGAEDADPRQGMQQYQLQGEKEIEKRYAHQDFLDQVIGKADKNLAMIGEPGAGKTTWLQQIVKYLRGIPPTPLTEGGLWLGFLIWIPLANLGEFTLEEYLLNRWLKDAFSLLEPTTAQKQALVDLFNSGKVWLLLDGVDEMKTANPLTQIAQSLTGWVKKARVVLTCRLNVWEANPNTLPEFDTYRTLCFAGEQVNDFISQWFGNTEKPELGQELQGKLAETESARIFDLVKNPLRLSLLCKAWWLNPGTLPTTQADLYQQFRDDFYLWKQQEFPTSWSQRQELNRRLGQLAFRAIGEKSPLRQSLVYAVLSEEWFELAEKLGWLNLVYRDIRTDEPIYAFFHLTFQEYFAALAVDDWDEFLPRTHVDRPVEGKEYSNSQVDDKQNENLSFPRRRESTIPGTKPEYRIFQPQWKQVILFWLGRSDVADKEKFDKKKEEFIEKLVKFADGIRNFYGYRAYFLAAAGISEFQTCSLADAIVKQIVRWGFGDYDEEEQKWSGYLDPIKEGAREILPQTERKLAIQELCQILKHPQCSESTRRQAALSLGKIGQNNQRAIDELGRILKHPQCSESTRRQAALSLGKIGQNNQREIDELGRILDKNKNKWIRSEAALSLGQIDPGNQTAIAALEEVLKCPENEFLLIREAALILWKIDPGNQTAIDASIEVLNNTTNYQDTRWVAADILGTIGQGNQTAIDELVRIIEFTGDKLMRDTSATSLRAIGQGNKTAIDALDKLLDNTNDEDIRSLAAYSLWTIDSGNQTAIAAFVKILETTEDEFTRWLAVESLGKIDPGNETAIAAFVKILETTEDEFTRWLAVESLGKIDPGNQTAIDALIEVLKSPENEFPLIREAAESLGEIDPGNQTAIAALVKVIETTENEDTRRQAAESLGKIGLGNQTAIAQLVRVLETTESEDTRVLTESSLVNIITTDEHRKTVVTALQAHLNHETYENNFELYKNCYEILWNIAQDLPYPDFYRAWHGLTETSAFVQTLELAQLPKNLQTKLSETNLNQTLQVFYIDASKFIGDNPAKAIYRQMTQQGGQKIDDKPKNMADLQDYWEDLIDDNDKQPVLIFYQDPSPPTPQGFSPTFLDMLTRFEGIICLITDQNYPGLKTFSPQDPQLIDNIMAWLERTILEM